MKAAIYLRISQDATGDQAGVSRQREDCIALVESQGWEVHDIYIDNDISASTGKARPGYHRMLKDIKDDLIDAVVAWHPDRLYRKLTDLEGLISAIEARNVIMRTHRAGELDLSTPTGRMLARILSATAQAEGEIKSDRWKRSWRQGRESGKPAKTGTRLFGYTRDSEVILDEAKIARRMADDLLAGHTILGISRWLDEEGILATRGGAWTPAHIKQFLLNPRIAGWSTLNGEIVAEGQWEPIIDRDTWEGCRALLQSRTRAYVPRVSLLNGLIFCGKCDHRMVTSKSRAQRTYRCPKRPGMNGCGGVSCNAEAAEEIVEGYAQAMLLDNADVLARVEALRGQPPKKQGEITELELRIRELEQQLDEPGVPVTTILRAIERAKERQQKLLSELSGIPRAPIPATVAEWPDDLRRRRALVDLVVGRVSVAPSTGGNRFDPARVAIEPR